MNKKREKLFTLTEKDFEFKFTRGSGKGGQKKNKTSSACQCFHRPSNSMGEAEDHREQTRNKKLAFERCTKTTSFQGWLKLKIEAALGNIEIEEADDFGTMRKRKVSHEEI